MQDQSKTEKLTYRISQAKHKQRLNEIKQQHNTSLQFYNYNKKQPENNKQILNLKLKKEKIEMENRILQDKIAKI
jgi:hypothetical protein